jgi:P4 family phage/plasmid primase-like protien
MDINFSKYFSACCKSTDDLFFLKSDVNKVSSYKLLCDSYKLCNGEYYHYSESTKLWSKESSDDSIHYRVCEYASDLLDIDKRLVYGCFEEYKNGDISRAQMDDLEEDIKKFDKFFKKVYKDYQKLTFSKSILKFINHYVIDDKFTDTININNMHLLPLIDCNLNLQTLKTEGRCKEQKFSDCVQMRGYHVYKNIDKYIQSDEFKIVDKFFLDICTGSQNKKLYLQKILGYFLTGDVPHGRTFYIFYGQGANGKSAIMDVLNDIMGYFCKTVPTSIILKRAKRGEGQASPEIAVLDYGNRLGVLSETDEGEQINEDLVKRISGYDSIDYRPLYKEPKQFRCESKLVMITNNKPYFNLSQSMVDRIRYLEFKSRFVQEGETLSPGHYQRNPDLIHKLKTVYKDYVLLWCALGAKIFFEDKHMNVPDDEELQKENLSYINSCDSFNRFINEYCVISPDGKALKSVIWHTYKKFIDDEKIPKALTKGKLNELLIEKFGQPVKNSVDYYYGFSMIEQKQYENKKDDDKGFIDKDGLDSGL